MRKKVVTRGNVVKLVFLAAAVFAATGFMYSSRGSRIERVEASTVNEDTINASPDPAKSRAAFKEAVKVFFSARCINCHPGGDVPLQGDSNTPHGMEVKRGPDGRGVGELKCTTCHQDINLEGDNMPPGVPDWHMPGTQHKMVFQGVTAAQLCRNLKDPLQNGGRKSAKESVEHILTDPKVIWSWTPGNGRTTPPLSHADFVKKLNEWIAEGAACPE